jgi:hypothetical protein
MPEQPDELFAKLMPGYDVRKAKRTPEGYPYVQEEASFEPGTYGQRGEGKPLVRLSPKAKPQELQHELEHLRQLYQGSNLDAGYDEPKLTSLYQGYGLTPDEAGGLAYGMRPSEVAARAAAKDPGDVFQQLLRRVQEKKLARQAGTVTPSGRRFMSK